MFRVLGIYNFAFSLKFEKFSLVIRFFLTVDENNFGNKIALLSWDRYIKTLQDFFPPHKNNEIECTLNVVYVDWNWSWKARQPKSLYISQALR